MISTVHSLLTTKRLAALLLIGLFTKRYRGFEATRETREGNRTKKIKLFGRYFRNVNASGVLFPPILKTGKKSSCS